MKFSTHVALPKRILTAKSQVEIHMYSDVTPFYKILIRSTTIINNNNNIHNFYFYDVIPYDVTPFFYLLFTLFIVGKKCYSIPPLKKRDLDTNSIKDLSFFPQLNTKKGEKIKVWNAYIPG